MNITDPELGLPIHPYQDHPHRDILRLPPLIEETTLTSDLSTVDSGCIDGGI